MDGRSRAKLVRAGYAIFRMRDVWAVRGGPAKPTYEIREMSARGQWVLYGRYPNKAARVRAWRELAKDEKHITESDEPEPLPTRADTMPDRRYRAICAGQGLLEGVV